MVIPGWIKAWTRICSLAFDTDQMSKTNQFLAASLPTAELNSIPAFRREGEMHSSIGRSAAIAFARKDKIQSLLSGI
jgi:hypothetical protein